MGGSHTVNDMFVKECCIAHQLPMNLIKNVHSKKTGFFFVWPNPPAGGQLDLGVWPDKKKKRKKSKVKKNVDQPEI